MRSNWSLSGAACVRRVAVALDRERSGVAVVGRAGRLVIWGLYDFSSTR